MVIQPGGNVGIGTTGPAQLLHINSGSANAAALVQTSTNAFAQYQLKSGGTNPWIIGTQDNFASNALLFRNGSTDLMTIKPDGSVGITGNVTQGLDKGGMVKAMVIVAWDLPPGQKIVRCFNSVLTGSAATTAPCGLTVDHSFEGLFSIVFPFSVTQRFFSVTTLGAIGESFVGKVDDFFGNTVRVRTFRSSDGSNRNSNFTLIVY